MPEIAGPREEHLVEAGCDVAGPTFAEWLEAVVHA